VVMQEMGHTDPGLALKVYAQAMRRGEHEQAQLRRLVQGDQLAVIGRSRRKRDSRGGEARGRLSLKVAD
jgi:hypothetical protein